MLGGLQQLQDEVEEERQRSAKLQRLVAELQEKYQGEKSRASKAGDSAVANPCPVPSLTGPPLLSFPQASEGMEVAAAELRQRHQDLQGMLQQWKAWGQKRHEEARRQARIPRKA